MNENEDKRPYNVPDIETLTAGLGKPVADSARTNGTVDISDFDEEEA